MRVLHLITDHQVIERTLEIYEDVFPGCNDILVFKEDNKPFKRLKDDYTGRIVNHNNLTQIATSYDFSATTHVIAHYMSMDKIDFIRYVPKDVHVCWEIYGYDLYNQFLEPMGYKNHYTDPIKYGNHPFLRKYFGGVLKIYHALKGEKCVFAFQKKRVFKYICSRVDSLQYCCGYDAKFVRDFARRSIPSYEIFNYSLDKVLGELKNVNFFQGEDILIGNSASFSNNHLYLLEYLKMIKIPETARIIIPLSYGGNKKYADDVVARFNRYYPNQLEILRSYIPLHEYNNMFLKLKAMFLPAWRQEQQGTAIMGFYFGIKVYMSEKNPLYKWFVDCGFIVYPIEKMTIDDLSIPLNEDDKKENRKLVETHYCDEMLRNNLRKFIK